MAGHSHTKIWIHLVWATKHRDRRFDATSGPQLYEHLMNAAFEWRMEFDRLNIQPEHVHGLVNLLPACCLSDFMKQMKGESARWLNTERILLDGHFAWQAGYGAYSVSASLLPNVQNYIKHQTEHHQRQSFAEEYAQWKQRYGILDD